jgi:cell division protein FtsB
MKIKKKKISNEEKIFQIFFFIFTLGLIIFLILSNLRIEKKKRELGQKIENLKSQIQELEEKGKKLESAISQTQKESYWEELAREEGYVREGEEAIVIKKVENEKEKIEEKEKIWLKFWQEFKKFFKK